MEKAARSLIDFSKVRKKKLIKEEIKIESEFEDIVLEGLEDENNKENKEPIEMNKFITDDSCLEYSYDFLLDRVNELIKKHNPQMTEKEKISLPVPNVCRASTTRSNWTNFGETSTMINRPIDHLFQFILSELGTEGSVTAENQLLLKGKYNNKHMESLLKKYVIEYVQCQNCKSINTLIKKDNLTRMNSIECKNCLSTRTVATIKASVKGRKDK
jgi:translation initiation factor 2 beta subunit (eIF-2beta)/eIF-5